MKNILIAISLIISASSFAQSKIGHDGYTSSEERFRALHCYAQELLDANKIDQAWQVLLK